MVNAPHDFTQPKKSWNTMLEVCTLYFLISDGFEIILFEGILSMPIVIKILVP